MTTHEEANASARPRRDERLNMRISSEALTLIREAAAAQNQDVTSFVLGAALDRAREVRFNEQFMELTLNDILDIEAALMREPQVLEQFVHRLRRAKETITVAHADA